MKQRNLPKQNRPTIIPDEIFNKILEDYKNLISYKKLFEIYGYGRIVIQNNFKTRKINFSKRRHKKNNQQVKENPFKDLSNPEVQYWLGWLASDGAIGGTRIALAVQEKDKEILEKFNNFLGNTCKIKQVKKKMNNKIFIGYRLIFRNIEISEFLKTLGITENKSKTINLNFPLTFSCLRGIVEGDGYIDSKRNRIQIVSASPIFIRQISDFIFKYNIKHGIYYHKPSNLESLQIAKHSSVLKFLELLYENAHNSFLQRKYDNAAQIRNNLMKTPEPQETSVRNPEASQQLIGG